ncbi:MAG: SMC family ATPase, partial [Muribaculaceae bacterium]|nr:SMC family ATPase [Muribaculaceae bacterium]
DEILIQSLSKIGMTENELNYLNNLKDGITPARAYINDLYNKKSINEKLISDKVTEIDRIKQSLLFSADCSVPKVENVDSSNELQQNRTSILANISNRLVELDLEYEKLVELTGNLSAKLEANEKNLQRIAGLKTELDEKKAIFEKWRKIHSYFGGTRFRTLVQSHILRPLLRNANVYLHRITDRFTLTCSDTNEQLAILVEDAYNKGQVRSATLLSGGEKFMISLALSLSLSAMNKSDMNVDILFIDEGFGTLDATSLNSVMETLRRLPDIVGQNGRRVGVISHREELEERIDTQIRVLRNGEGRSRLEIYPTQE